MKIKTATSLLVITLSLFGGGIIAVTLYSLSNSYEIKSTWLGVKETHSDRDHALNILRSEIGYGGMIHNFKNYILRRNIINADAVKSSLGGAKAAIALYRTFDINQREIEALDDIETNLLAYGDSLPIIASLIEQNKNATEIDNVVKINDSKAVTGFNTLMKYSTLEHPSNTYYTSKAKMIYSMRHAMGFNGMIHNFKNAILRGNLDALLLAEQNLKKAKQTTISYLNLDLNDIELRAIRQIQNTLNVYESTFNKARKIIFYKSLPENIDRMVKVDDKPALDGFIALNKEILLQSNEAEENLTRTLQLVIDAGEIVLFLTTLAILFLIGGIYWLIRMQIITPVEKLTNTITSIANENIDVEIYGVEKNDEIGTMARSVEVFKKNIIRLRSAKQELKASNEELESRVLDRTKALKNSEKKLYIILETAADAIITIDENGIVLTFNLAAEGMFGYNSDEIVGQNVNILMSKSLANKHGDYISRHIKSGKRNILGLTREIEGLRKNGGNFPILLSVSKVEYSDGILFTGIIRDISEIKAYQKKLQISENKAKAANKAKSNFIAHMNHELRTPMNAVLGFTQLLDSNPNEPLTENQKMSIDEIKNAGDHLLNMINQILELNHIETGNLAISLSKLNPTRCIQESLALLSQKANSENIEIIDQIVYETLPDIYTDAIYLKEILINLLSNAIKYNKLNGTVTISAVVLNGYFRFSIKDTGKGIPAERQAETFLPFERLGHESSNIEGSGIGLTITKNIVEQMLGKIDFSSKEGEGSHFWFELPIYTESVN